MVFFVRITVNQSHLRPICKSTKFNPKIQRTIYLINFQQLRLHVPDFIRTVVATNIKLLEDVEQVLNELRIQLVKQFILEYGDIVSHIMSYFSNHDEKYTFNSVDDIEHIKLEIHANLKSEYVTTPHEYFNEFRFKLYCVAMKMAISFYWILQHRISAPIVIDDVFNANDFENSIKLEQFAYFMKKAYYELLLSDKTRKL